MLIAFVPKKQGSYYLHLSLKEYKYIEKEKEVVRHITKDLEISYDDELDESDEK